MTYRVILSPHARHEMYEDAIWWGDHHDPAQADRWLDGFEKALTTLAANADKHPRAPESDLYSIDLRQMLYGLGKRPTHRAVFQIQGEEVFVHAIRHLARKDLRIETFDN